jgi:hypothetical protein
VSKVKNQWSYTFIKKKPMITVVCGASVFAAKTYRKNEGVTLVLFLHSADPQKVKNVEV